MKTIVWKFLICLVGFSYLNAKEMWEKTDYVWNFAIASVCHFGLDPNPWKYFARDSFFQKTFYKKLEKGDAVWIKCRFIPEFCEQVLPKIKEPFILVISDGDESFPSHIAHEIDVEEFICNEKILHIFSQNCDYKGSSNKVSPLPIGMDFHTIAYKGENGGWGEKGSPREQESLLKKLLKDLPPTYLRKKRAFVDFQHSDSMGYGECKRYLETGETRTSIFNQLLLTNLIDYGSWMRRSELWKTKGQYAFSISPHGNGLDCHRTWEDLILGCIVIVKTSPLDSLYEGLPVVIVKDWSEITEENMEKWLQQYADAFTNPSYRQKLTNDYWIKKIQRVVP